MDPAGPAEGTEAVWKTYAFLCNISICPLDKLGI